MPDKALRMPANDPLFSTEAHFTYPWGQLTPSRLGVIKPAQTQAIPCLLTTPITATRPLIRCEAPGVRGFDLLLQ